MKPTESEEQVKYDRRAVQNKAKDKRENRKKSQEHWIDYWCKGYGVWFHWHGDAATMLRRCSVWLSQYSVQGFMFCIFAGWLAGWLACRLRRANWTVVGQLSEIVSCWFAIGCGRQVRKRKYPSDVTALSSNFQWWWRRTKSSSIGNLIGDPSTLFLLPSIRLAIFQFFFFTSFKFIYFLFLFIFSLSVSHLNFNRRQCRPFELIFIENLLPLWS